jgi:hypothetical protein
MQAGVPGTTDGLAAGIGTTEFPDRIRSFASEGSSAKALWTAAG